MVMVYEKHGLRGNTQKDKVTVLPTNFKMKKYYEVGAPWQTVICNINTIAALNAQPAAQPKISKTGL